MSAIWQRILSEQRRFPELFGTGATDASIEVAELALGMRFDPDYREFLRLFGSGMVGSLPVLGLSKAEALGNDAWNVVATTKRFRADKWPGIADWYLVSIDGSGNPIGIGPDGCVRCSDLDVGDTTEAAPTFLAFLEAQLADPLTS